MFVLFFVLIFIFFTFLKKLIQVLRFCVRIFVMWNNILVLFVYYVMVLYN